MATRRLLQFFQCLVREFGVAALRQIEPKSGDQMTVPWSPTHRCRTAPGIAGRRCTLARTSHTARNRGRVFQRNSHFGTLRKMNHSRDKPLVAILCASITCRPARCRSGQGSVFVTPALFGGILKMVLDWGRRGGRPKCRAPSVDSGLIRSMNLS